MDDRFPYPSDTIDLLEQPGDAAPYQSLEARGLALQERFRAQRRAERARARCRKSDRCDR